MMKVKNPFIHDSKEFKRGVELSKADLESIGSKALVQLHNSGCLEEVIVEEVKAEEPKQQEKPKKSK